MKNIELVSVELEIDAELLIALTKIKEFEAEIEKKNFQINELIKLINNIKTITAKLNFI